MPPDPLIYSMTLTKYVVATFISPIISTSRPKIINNGLKHRRGMAPRLRLLVVFLRTDKTNYEKTVQRAYTPSIANVLFAHVTMTFAYLASALRHRRPKSVSAVHHVPIPFKSTDDGRGNPSTHATHRKRKERKTGGTGKRQKR